MFIMNKYMNFRDPLERSWLIICELRLGIKLEWFKALEICLSHVCILIVVN